MSASLCLCVISLCESFFKYYFKNLNIGEKSSVLTKGTKLGNQVIIIISTY